MFELFFRTLDPTIHFSTSVFGNISFGPLSNYYRGYEEEKGRILKLCFEDGYCLKIQKEFVADVYKVEKCRYFWQLLHQEEGCDILIDVGVVEADSAIGRIALAQNVLKRSIQKVIVKGNYVSADADWTITAAEAEILYQTYGPFRMVFDEKEADVIWIREADSFSLAEELR